MTASTEIKKLSPNELTLQSIEVSDGFDDLYAATIRAEFRGVEDGFEKTLLTKIIEALPTLLPVLGESDVEDRIKHFCRTLQVEDWRPNSRSEMLLNGRMEVERFFKEVPLLTEDEVKERMPSNSTITLSQLMQVTYDGQTFYFADQFAPDGSIHPECIECWRILKSDPSSHEWDMACWWMYSTGWLGGSAPRDIFKEESELVLHAAEQEILQNES